MAKKILVIDDDADILDAIKLILEFEGYTVEPVLQKHGDLMRLVTADPPQLILMDVLLSGNDGRQLTRRLKSDTVTKSIPVILISAHPNVRRSSLESGADEFLAKPFDMDKLLDLVSRFMGNRDSGSFTRAIPHA